jgi:NAD(P)-dependent dehydrogenase (short-subunit alcohol dehydrogenase family)
MSAAHGRGRWMLSDVPDQSGRTAVVTGASGGLGLETANALAGRNATVVLACRDPDSAARAADRIRVSAGDADIRVVGLDLASLASVREAAAEIRATCPRIDLLINNAGVMQVPSHRRSADGFELTLATNHLGHFALTGLVLDRLLATPGSRIVTVSSLAHRRGVMDFDDVQTERNYKPGDAYDRSKLANLLFTYELQRRLDAQAAGTIALAAHPGIASTDLWRTSSRLERAVMGRGLRMLTFWLVQSAKRGALPTLRAALDPSAQGGDYFGPGGVFQFTGDPIRVESSPCSHDETARRRLWQASEELTGVSYARAAG